MTKLQTTTTAAPASRSRRVKLSYDQFLQWDGENQHVEWVNGEVVPMAPISDEHDDVDGLVYPLLLHFVQHHELGTVRHDPFQMKTGPDLPGRAPDVLFVARRNRRRLHRTFVDGPADLVVEIISPDSRTIDRVDKFREYEQGGVREYWVIDPARRRAEFYRRGRDGRFRIIPVGDDGIFRSLVLKGLWLKVAWLWERPPLVAVLKEWGLV